MFQFLHQLFDVHEKGSVVAVYYFLWKQDNKNRELFSIIILLISISTIICKPCLSPNKKLIYRLVFKNVTVSGFPNKPKYCGKGIANCRLVNKLIHNYNKIWATILINMLQFVKYLSKRWAFKKKVFTCLSFGTDVAWINPIQFARTNRAGSHESRKEEVQFDHDAVRTETPKMRFELKKQNRK